MVEAKIIRKGSQVFLYDTLNEPITVLDNVNGEITLKLKRAVKTNADELFPVPLTDENIIKCGFFKTDSYVYEHPVERVELEIDHAGITHMYVHNHKTTVSLKALHELQHAFWLYTSKELNYKK